LLMLSNLRAYVTVIDLRAWKKSQATIDKLRAPLYGHAYFLAFQHQCEMMALDVRQFSEYARIAFLFDEHEEFQGRALKLHTTLKQSKRLAFVSRLGAIAFDDSE